MTRIKSQEYTNKTKIHKYKYIKKAKLIPKQTSNGQRRHLKYLVYILIEMLKSLFYALFLHHVH